VVGATTLQEQYISNLVHDCRSANLHGVMESSPPSMTFRRNVAGPHLTSWNELLQRLASIQLVQGKGIFCAGNSRRMVYHV
jgi:hypothetical protein